MEKDPKIFVYIQSTFKKIFFWRKYHIPAVYVTLPYIFIVLNN